MVRKTLLIEEQPLWVQNLALANPQVLPTNTDFDNVQKVHRFHLEVYAQDVRTSFETNDYIKYNIIYIYIIQNITQHLVFIEIVKALVRLKYVRMHVNLEALSKDNYICNIKL